MGLRRVARTTCRADGGSRQYRPSSWWWGEWEEDRVAEAVRHMRLGINLNLSRADLGHPELPGLWRELRCMGTCYRNDPDCRDKQFRVARKVSYANG
jgi:hypothetical protein